MTWNFLQLEVIPDDALVRPMIGPGGLTRAEAHAEILSILTRLAAVQPAAQKLVAAWKRGAPDDTVGVGPFTWAIYEADDPMAGAKEWMDGYIAILRGAGVDVGVSW